jgi:hypothetical protein
VKPVDVQQIQSLLAAIALKPDAQSRVEDPSAPARSAGSPGTRPR